MKTTVYAGSSPSQLPPSSGGVREETKATGCFSGLFSADSQGPNEATGKRIVRQTLHDVLAAKTLQEALDHHIWWESSGRAKERQEAIRDLWSALHGENKENSNQSGYQNYQEALAKIVQVFTLLYPNADSVSVNSKILEKVQFKQIQGTDSFALVLLGKPSKNVFLSLNAQDAGVFQSLLQTNGHFQTHVTVSKLLVSAAKPAETVVESLQAEVDEQQTHEQITSFATPHTVPTTPLPISFQDAMNRLNHSCSGRWNSIKVRSHGEKVISFSIENDEEEQLHFRSASDAARLKGYIFAQSVKSKGLNKGSWKDFLFKMFVFYGCAEGNFSTVYGHINYRENSISINATLVGTSEPLVIPCDIPEMTQQFFAFAKDVYRESLQAALELQTGSSAIDIAKRMQEYIQALEKKHVKRTDRHTREQEESVLLWINAAEESIQEVLPITALLSNIASLKQELSQKISAKHAQMEELRSIEATNNTKTLRATRSAYPFPSPLQGKNQKHAQSFQRKGPPHDELAHGATLAPLPEIAVC